LTHLAGGGGAGGRGADAGSGRGDAAAALADGAFYNTGQSCCSVERIYVNKKIYDAFVEAFVREVKTFKMGDPTNEETYIGPLTRPQQLDVLKQQVEDAKQKGAKLLTGGKRTTVNGKGYFFEPTVFSNVNNRMLLMREESFGPIIGIQSVENDEEAVRLMNDNDYGLTAGVYSKDEQRAKNILTQIESGTVYWNCCDRVSPPLPWSGRKGSGIGSTLSKVGIKAFVQPKAWHWKSPN